MERTSWLCVIAALVALTASGCMGDEVVRTHLDEPPRPMGCNFELRTDMPAGGYDDVATVTAHVAVATDPAIHEAVARAVCEHGGDAFVVTDDENGTVRGEVVKLRDGA